MHITLLVIKCSQSWHFQKLFVLVLVFQKVLALQNINNDDDIVMFGSCRCVIGLFTVNCEINPFFS